MSGVETAFKELARLELDAREIAFVFHSLSTVVVKTRRHMLLIDPADFFSQKDAENLGKVDAILITHEHSDHFNASRTVELQKRTQATVVCNVGAHASMRGRVSAEKLKVVEADGAVEVDGVRLRAIESVHPGRKPLMFLVESDESKFFHGSDSGYTAALEKHTGRARVAFVPVGTPSPTASVDDAVKMAKALGCEKAVPIHGSSGEVSRFKERMRRELPNVQVTVPEPLMVYRL